MNEQARYRLGCRVTNEQARISGQLHVKVIKPNGFTIFLDPSFLYGLQHANEDAVIQALIRQFAATLQEARLIIVALIKAGLLIADDGAAGDAPRDSGCRTHDESSII